MAVPSSDLNNWLAARLAPKIGTMLPEVWTQRVWQNNTPATLPAGQRFYLPWDGPGDPTGEPLSDIQPGEYGVIRYTAYKAEPAPADVILEIDVDEQRGTRSFRAVSVADLADLFAGAMPAALPPQASPMAQAQFDALVSHDTGNNLGYYQHLQQWRTEGLI